MTYVRLIVEFVVKQGEIPYENRTYRNVLVDALTDRLKADGYGLLSGPRTTGDGYYESCILGIEGNQIEITV